MVVTLVLAPSLARRMHGGSRRQQQQPQRQRHQQPPPVGSTLIIAERIQAGVAAFVLNKRVLAASGLINAKPHRV